MSAFSIPRFPRKVAYSRRCAAERLWADATFGPALVSLLGFLSTTDPPRRTPRVLVTALPERRKARERDVVFEVRRSEITDRLSGPLSVDARVELPPPFPGCGYF